MKGTERVTNTAFLDRGITIEGSIRFEMTLRVAGTVKGEIRGGKELVIDEPGVVEGTVRVESLYVRGTVRADDIEVRRLEIFPGGSVEGTVRTKVLVVHEGGIFQAQCDMNLQREKKISKAVESKKPEPPIKAVK